MAKFEINEIVAGTRSSPFPGTQFRVIGTDHMRRMIKVALIKPNYEFQKQIANRWFHDWQFDEILDENAQQIRQWRRLGWI